jgi:hypothetical protein
VESDASQIFGIGQLAAYKFKYQVWARDIRLRRNSVTSTWVDARELITQREIIVCTHGGDDVPVETFLDVLDGMRGQPEASMRWAVIVGDGNKLQLALQMLPAGAGTVNGRPLLKG